MTEILLGKTESDVPLPLKKGLEAVQIQHEGLPMILLRDQEGIVAESLIISIVGFMLALLFDGKSTYQDIQTAFNTNSGVMVPQEEIKKIAKQLNSQFFLDGPDLKDKRKKTNDDFLQNPVRKPYLQNRVYPENKLELAVQLGGYFKDAKGPRQEIPSNPTSQQYPRCLISPHIDFARGGPAYAWAYQALGSLPVPDVIVSFGVAHASPPSPWVFSKKRFQTPYGEMKVDEDLYQELAKTLWYDVESDELVHRTEHSLEFQALWLQYLWKEKTPAWVPILCSSFDQFCPDRPPSTIATIDEALKKMGNVLLEKQKKGMRILILAGIDLAHVGPRFGDEEKLGPELNARIEKEDRNSLEKALRLDADGFYMSVVADGHWRKVCGLSALYSSLRVLNTLNTDNNIQGSLLCYDQAADPLGGVVSFASALFK